MIARCRRFKVGRLVYEGGRWAWYGPCNCYTFRAAGVVKTPRTNL